MEESEKKTIQPPPPPPLPPKQHNSIPSPPVKIQTSNGILKKVEKPNEKPPVKSVLDYTKFQIKLPDVNIGKKTIKTVRIVHISDTHNKHEMFRKRIPDGDILVHSGDFCNKMNEEDYIEQTTKFNEFLGTLPHKYKIFVAGNHEEVYHKHSAKELQQLLTNCFYLQDSSITIEGITFYGSPWTPSSNMGFSCPWSELPKKWKMIPTNTDILITHQPPQNVLDLAWVNIKDFNLCKLCSKEHPSHRHWGCPSLLKHVLERVRPKAHLFGHVHDDVGMKQIDGVMFVNSAMSFSGKCHYFDYHVQSEKKCTLM